MPGGESADIPDPLIWLAFLAGADHADSSSAPAS